MKHKNKTINNFLQITIDVISFVITIFLAFYIRHGYRLNPHDDRYQSLVAIEVIVYILLLIFYKPYEEIYYRGKNEELLEVCLFNSILFISSMILLYFTKSVEPISRGTLLIQFFIYLFFSYVSRSIQKQIAYNKYNKRKNNKLVRNDSIQRIAMFGHKRIPSREGGIEIVVEELCTRMVNKKYDVTVFNRSGHNVAGKQYDNDFTKEYKGIHIKSVVSISLKGLSAVTSSISAAIASAFGKFDVVHIHAEGPALMCWIPKLFRKKVVVTIHGLDHQRAKWGKFASWYIMKGEENAVKYADHIIVLSKGVQNYFKEVYDRETEFIPNGVNKPEIKDANIIKNAWGLGKDSYILYLGRIVPEKGAHLLIQAFKHIDTNKKLVIAGGSSDTSGYLKEIKNLALNDDRVIFTDFVQGEKWEELYSNAYMYCLPSNLEGMPLSLLEAMSYGNCCLTSDIDECVDVVKDKAISFRAGDSIDLKDKLEYLLQNPEVVKKYKKNASKYICEKYIWDEVVDKTLELYRK